MKALQVGVERKLEECERTRSLSAPGCLVAHTIYVVAGRPADKINDRIAKLGELRDAGTHVQILHLGEGESADGLFVGVPPIRNPLGLLGHLGAKKLQAAAERLVYFPSRKVLFAKAVTRKLRLELRRRGVAANPVLLTALPPHALCKVGIALKKEFPRLRWVIDWQDLWSCDENYFGRLHPIHRKAALRLERAALQEADLNITTNELAARYLTERLGVPQTKVAYIPHGYGEDDLSAIGVPPPTSREQNDSIKIGFLGSLFKPPRVPGERIAAVMRKLRDDGIPVRLCLFGGDSKAAKQAACRFGDDCIELHGRKPHLDSLESLATCDLLLVYLEDLPNSRLVMSIKLPFYLISGRPIIAVVPVDSANANLVRSSQAGVIVPVEGDWERGLERVLRDWSSGRELSATRQEIVARLHWRNLSRKWQQCLLGIELSAPPKRIEAAPKLEAVTEK